MGLRSLFPSFGRGALREEHHECSNRAESKSPGDYEGKRLFQRAPPAGRYLCGRSVGILTPRHSST